MFSFVALDFCMNDISVIIINYNTAKYTLKCIQSVIDFTTEKLSYNIIVVDNNSELDDFKHLKSNFPKAENISLHRSVINAGFRSEEHTSELQSRLQLVCRLLLEKKKKLYLIVA